MTSHSYPIHLVAEGSIIKLGKQLAVLEVSGFSEDDIVAHVTGTYSIPPNRRWQ